MHEEVGDSFPVLNTRYPAGAADRNAWIESQRPPRHSLDPWKTYAAFVEDEYSSEGVLTPVATLFLTNRECPLKCVMCDLWRNTLTESVPEGAIPAQIDEALSRLPEATQIKLYNSGSFFDKRAIPEADYPAIALRVNHFERLIVECHPALIGQRYLRFQQMLSCHLEVALGLETAHEGVLERLNKQMTLDQFRRAADFLKANGSDVRAFVLIRPPFLSEEEGLVWAQRSVDVAFDAGAAVVSLIPTRGGNGAMDQLARQGDFAPPCLRTIEKAAEYGVCLGRGRVFVDLWDLKRRSECVTCFAARVERLQQMNQRQVLRPPIQCQICGAGN